MKAQLSPTEGNRLRVISVFVVLLLLASAPCTKGALVSTYYVDATGGNDANDGLSPATAWKTIGKVNSVHFYAGDSVLFKRGEVWRTPDEVPRSGLRIRFSGFPQDPITFGAYGNGQRPQILGSTNITGGQNNYTWERSAQPNEWYLLPVGNPAPLHHVWVDGIGYTRGAVGSLSMYQWDHGNNDGLPASTIYIYSTTDPDEPTKAVEASYDDIGVEISENDPIDHIVIENFIINYYGQDNANDAAIYIENDVNDVLISNVTLSRNYQGLFAIGSDGMNPTISDVSIIDCTAKYNSAHGLCFLRAKNVTISHTSSSHNGEHGLTFMQDSGYTDGDLVLSGVSMSNNDSSGAVINGVGGHVSIRDNSEMSANGMTNLLVKQVLGSLNVEDTVCNDSATRAGLWIRAAAGDPPFPGDVFIDHVTAMRNQLDNIRIDGEALGGDVRISECTAICSVEQRGIQLALVAFPSSVEIYRCTADCNNLHGIHVYGSSAGVDIRKNTMTGNRWAGVLVEDNTSDDIKIYNNLFTDNNTAGDGATAYVSSPNTKIYNNLIRGSFCRAIKIWARDGKPCDNVEVHHNLILSPIDDGIEVRADTVQVSGLKVYNNTLYNIGNSGNGLEFLTDEGTIEADVKNNIFHGLSARRHVYVGETTGQKTFDNNDYYPEGDNMWQWGNIWDIDNLAAWQKASGQDANAIALDPLFNSAPTGDLTLQAGSPCIDAGANLGALYDDGLHPNSTWPHAVFTLDQDEYGIGWEIGAYVHTGFTEEPRILSILDIGNDQGRRVRIKWLRSSHDAPGQPHTITNYGVYRRQDDFLRTDLRIGGAGGEPGPRAIGEEALLLDGWDYLLSVPARGDSVYQTVAPTLCDSTTSNGMCWSVFFVSAMTPDPLVYFDSPPDSGYSIDNLAPETPENFRHEVPFLLVWDESRAPDFRYFTLYHSEVDHLEESAVVIGKTTETSMDIQEYLGHAYYHLTATDFSGNEGEEATLPWMSIGVIGAGTVPRVYALHQIRPNPAAGGVISFDLPSESDVQLKIFDPSGRMVVRVVDERLRAGSHSMRWDGFDNRGMKVPAGVYFYRLEAGTFTDTKRLVLAR